MLSTQALSIGYHHKPLITGLELQLNPGEMVCLVGPNGVGKSTLLRTLAGMQMPIHGIVMIDGQDIGKLSTIELARQLAIVLTGKLDVGNLSAYELVSLGRHPYTSWQGRLSFNDIEVTQQVMQITDSDSLAHRHVNELSDGERQRVMIARALAQEPKILLLDEPTAFLDLPRRVDILLLLKSLTRKTKCAVLLATHDLDLALSITDRLWIMNSKGDFSMGIPEELALNGSLADTFESKGVSFDNTSGLFKVHQQINGMIELVGEGTAAFWTQRALERIGFAVNAPNMTKLMKIVISQGMELIWKLQTPVAIRTFLSLPELIGYLNDNLGSIRSKAIS